MYRDFSSLSRSVSSASRRLMRSCSCARRVSSRIATDRRWFWQSIVVNTAITATGMPCATMEKSFRP